MRRIRNVLFLLILLAGFLASRAADARAQTDCWACTGIFGETCEPCEGGEDCGRLCGVWDPEGNAECRIFGEICQKPNN
jgi:hypothetical protein